MTQIPAPKKPEPDLVVTRHGIPVPDQAQGLRDFAAACSSPNNAFFQEPIPTLPRLTTTLPGHPLAKLAVTLLQPTAAGHTLILGFPTKLDAMKAQDWLFDKIKQATVVEPCEVRQLAERLGNMNRSVFGGSNPDYLDAIEMLVDCSDSIEALGDQLARQYAELQRQADLIARARVLAPLAFHIMEKKK